MAHEEHYILKLIAHRTLHVKLTIGHRVSHANFIMAHYAKLTMESYYMLNQWMAHKIHAYQLDIF